MLPPGLTAPSPAPQEPPRAQLPSARVAHPVTGPPAHRRPVRLSLFNHQRVIAET